MSLLKVRQEGTTNRQRQKSNEHPLFEVKNLSLSFKNYQSKFHEANIEVIKKFDLTINQGEIVAIVGASGSGKSLLADAILGIIPKNATVNGTMKFDGKDLTEERQLKLRGKEIALIPQSVNALDPLMKAGKQVLAMVKGKSKGALLQRVFQKVGLPNHTVDCYPFELSGGMARRVLISTAMVSRAKLIIADEPTPGLDEASREETIRFLKELAMEGKGIMFITHDISAALQIADKIAVFYAGYTVEIASRKDFTGKGERLRHPYTRALWNALPENDFIPIAGSQPLSSESIDGCIFLSRCPLATNNCSEKQPQPMEVDGGMVRCFHAGGK